MMTDGAVVHAEITAAAVTPATAAAAGAAANDDDYADAVDDVDDVDAAFAVDDYAAADANDDADADDDAGGDARKIHQEEREELGKELEHVMNPSKKYHALLSDDKKTNMGSGCLSITSKNVCRQAKYEWKKNSSLTKI